MASEMNPDKVAEQARLYRERKAKKEAEEAERKAAAEKRQAEIRAIQEKREKPRRLRKEQVCCECHGKIAKGEMGKPQTVSTGFGWPEGFHRITIYRHYPECPKKEP